MSNKSAAYGYYGGVAQINHYVPPKETDTIPQTHTAIILASAEFDSTTTSLSSE